MKRVLFLLAIKGKVGNVFWDELPSFPGLEKLQLQPKCLACKLFEFGEVPTLGSMVQLGRDLPAVKIACLFWPTAQQTVDWQVDAIAVPNGSFLQPKSGVDVGEILARREWMKPSVVASNGELARQIHLLSDEMIKAAAS